MVANIIRNVPKAHIAPKVHRFFRLAKTSYHRFYKVSLPGDSHVASLLRITEGVSFVAFFRKRRCFYGLNLLAVLFTVYVSARYFDNRPVFVARPNFSAVHFDYFLRESKPYAGISLFARVKPFKNVRKIILVNAVAVVVNRALVPLLKQFDNFLVVHFASPSTSKNRLRFVDDQTLRLTIKTTKNPRRCVKVK